MAVIGEDALNALNTESGGGNNNEFASFKSGTKYFVKVLGTADIMSFHSYGIFKQVNSFVANNPSKKTPTGYPVENLTPWDKAWKYRSEEHTSELQSRFDLVCRLLLEKKKTK